MGVADRPRPPSVGHARARARACAGQPTWTWLSGVHRQAASSDGVTLLELLEVVVVVGALVLARRLDDALELVAHLRLGVADVEPLAQPREHLAQRRLLEARVPRAGARDLNHREDHVRVPVRRHHRLHAALGVRLVPRRADAAHQRDVLGGELPRSRLDDAADLLARRVAEAEAKVDVEEVAERVDHQVAVVPVAQQQQPHDDRVSRQRLDEARLRREEAVAVGRPVPLHEEGAQRGVPRRLLEPVEVLRRGDRLDQARVGAGGLDVVRPQPRELGREDLDEEPDQLHDEDLLTQVVVRLDDERGEAPAGRARALRRRPQPRLLGVPQLLLLLRKRQRRAALRAALRAGGSVAGGSVAGSRVDGRHRWLAAALVRVVVGQVSDGAAVGDRVAVLLHLEHGEDRAAGLCVEDKGLVAREGEDGAERLRGGGEGEVGHLRHRERVELRLQCILPLVSGQVAKRLGEVRQRAQKVALRGEEGVDHSLPLPLLQQRADAPLAPLRGRVERPARRGGARRHGRGRVGVGGGEGLRDGRRKGLADALAVGKARGRRR
mmetsp:Transcript_26898/g.86406  ORF Transcript_26898/g.86406 Transcript_26898/m.86406 type:complete len:552 (+) Transcript_26898:1102-2757(+)